MSRKFIKGDARNVVCHVKRGSKEVQCNGGGCKNMVTITTPYSGDILCAECSKGCSYSLVVDNEDPKTD